MHVAVIYGAFPYYDNSPAHLFKLSADACISFDIGREFGLPEFDVAGGGCCEATAWMAVPETSVNENRDFVLGKQDIRLPWQLGVQPKTQSRSMQEAAHDQLGFRVLATDAGHHPAARGGINNIGHQASRTRSWPAVFMKIG